MIRGGMPFYLAFFMNKILDTNPTTFTSQKHLIRIRLSDIDDVNHLATDDILSKVQGLQLKALGKINRQAILDTMQELKAHPQEYQEALEYINHHYAFFCDDSMQEVHICR